MSIQIYNSLTRKKTNFSVLDPHGKTVKIYACGPTVYDEPHIGHARSAYIFSVIRGYLNYRGYNVKFVRNVTDVDDKIIAKAKKEFPSEDLNISFKKVAEKYLGLYHEALESLGIDDSKVLEPKASQYIDKMIAFIEGLIKNNCAYVSQGDVYFDISKASSYGKLSNQSLDKMFSGSRTLQSEVKKNPLDFALWKSAKENEPSWQSPWGPGRPGWHIECSVMSSDILGDEFDIHGGGIDLIFPHHENEVAQSEGAGKKFARYWIHHGLLTINSQKMAKSLGNFITVKDFISKYDNPNFLKLFFLSTHYSHPIDYTDEKIKEARSSYERISIIFKKFDDMGIRLSGKNKENQEIEGLKNKFSEAMDDDFNTPQALSYLFELVNLANKNINDKDFSEISYFEISQMLSILGIKILNDKNIDGYARDMIAKRSELKLQKKFSEADKIRQELLEKGIIIEDNKNGTVSWRKKL